MENTDIYRQLGKRIREARKKLGITQKRLSSKAGISLSFLSGLERGIKKASLQTMKSIADALGVPIHNLFSPPKEPITYLKSDKDFFVRRLEELVRDAGDDFKKLLRKIATYLAEKEKG